MMVWQEVPWLRQFDVASDDADAIRKQFPARASVPFLCAFVLITEDFQVLFPPYPRPTLGGAEIW